MRWWPLLLLVVGCRSTEETSCQREFFAQPVIYDRAMSIDFYYTAINLSTPAACAAFCGDRHFCRTAVYNIHAKTCAISYEYTLNCRYNEERMKEFPTTNLTSHLIQIACVNKCNENTSRIAKKQKILAAEPQELPSATPATLKKVQLITGDPNDGFQSTKLARNHPKLTYDQPREPGFVNKVVIENFTAGGVLPVLDSRHTVRRKGQICYRLREKKYLMGAAYETHKEVSLQTCRCLCAHSYDHNSIFMCKSFNWRADGTCELNKANHLGKHDLIDDNRFIYQFIDCDVQILMGISTKFCTKEGMAVSNTLVKPGRTNASEDGLTSATTTPLPSTISLTSVVQIESTTFSTKATIEEITQGTSEETSSAPITEAEEKAGFFVGTRNEKSNETIIEETTEGTTTTSENAVTEGDHINTVTTPIITTTSETTTLIDKTEHVTTASTISETSVSTTIESKTESTTTALTTETSEATKPTETTTSIATTAAVTETTTPITTTAAVTETTTTLANALAEEKLEIEHSKCFERIKGRLMSSGAAALEHDVSLEECECFCANSRASGRHGFECISATYYHGERDCVLNLEDRNEKPIYFSAQVDEFNVTYLGLKCSRDKAISTLVHSDMAFGCRSTPQVTKSKKTKPRGAFSDSCFVELPSYVLEGNALHVETNATPQLCKCLCVTAEQKFGEACYSFQYYYEGSVCLLSKNNRFSQPEKFSFLPDQLLNSYFEYKCASNEDKLKKYSNQMCLFQKVIDDMPDKKLNGSLVDHLVPLLTKESSNSSIIEEKEGSGMETTTETTAGSPTTLLTTEATVATMTTKSSINVTETTTTIPITTTTIISTTTKKHRTTRPINKAIPEAEGLDEKDFLELDSILSNNLEETTMSSPFNKAHGVKTFKFTDKLSKSIERDTTSTIVTTRSTTLSTTPKTTTVTRRPAIRTTVATTTAKLPEYPSAGKCTYSALYQTAFLGRRMIKTVHVKVASDCFAACYALRCRSANLIAQGTLNQCELFRDSLIDYRRPDMIGYDGSTVYFDGIHCDGI